MSPALIAACVALADTLAQENAALRAHDVARAVALLARKQAETQALALAQAGIAALTPRQQALVREVAGRLAEAAAENKRLLERAIAVQGQMIAALLHTLPAALPMSRYGVGGARIGRPPPLRLSSRI